MSALDDDVLSAEPVTDLDVLASDRWWYFATYGVEMPLQDAEREVGLADADIWLFLRPPTSMSWLERQWKPCADSWVAAEVQASASCGSAGSTAAGCLLPR
ncbi:hypothetical protein [Jongsikchunia kroppenstedtii]|uniref:hypothetical protein n=1 Tax=Jongsikchunia kroppenstedtii TaxID=1121721 RepID=UPI0012DBD04C|nr:hypothetical protein [Jongsikchunia kroppenstedtii]